MSEPHQYLRWWSAVGWAALAVAAFHLAHVFAALGWLMVVYLGALVALRRLPSDRCAFYTGLGVGLLVYAPHMRFLFNIFGWASVPLWLVLPFWLAVFLLLARRCHARFGPAWGAMLIPILWTGIEFFRSELYYLKFSWLNAGYALAFSDGLASFGWLGMYGVGFLYMILMCVRDPRTDKRRYLVALLCIGLVALDGMWNYLWQRPPVTKTIRVAGLQLESADETKVPAELDRLLARFPQTDLIVLHEYCFFGPIPEPVRAWCRQHQKHLVVGGKAEAPDDKFFNTAFVIDPNGAIVFQQAKSRPIQFFQDGLPAREQKVWDSPWGKLGVCICYDLSYTRVTDPLVRQGAQALIVPTMDSVGWGRQQHELHARVAPVRAAEYGIPIVRVASSGISQIVDARGKVTASAPFSSEVEMIAGEIHLGAPGRLPLDRYLAPLCVAGTALVIVWLAVDSFRRRKSEAGSSRP